MARRRSGEEIEGLRLEHPDLDSFEPRLRVLGELVMGAVARLAHAKGLSVKDLFASEDPGITAEVRRVCHVAFEAAQQAIGVSLIEMETRVRMLEVVVKEHRRAQKTIGREIEQIGALNERILVLRRLVDAIAHQMLGMKPWIARRFKTERRVRRLDPEQLKQLLTFAKERNSEDADRFALVADMTTFVDVCDLVEVFFGTKEQQVRLIEIKEGRVNEEILQGESHTDDVVGDAKAARRRKQQIDRIQRQQDRLANVKQILDTDKGKDPVSGKALQMSRRELFFTGYAEQLRELVKRSRAAGGAQLTIDSSLRLAGFLDTKLEGASRADVIHLFHHMGGRHTPCLLETESEARELEALSDGPDFVDMVLFSTQATWALPIFLWEIEPESIFDLLALGGHPKSGHQWTPENRPPRERPGRVHFGVNWVLI